MGHLERNWTKLLILIAIRISSGRCGELPDYGVSDFSCPDEIMRPSSSIPENVNALRPADIKVVMAMGDSLTAGMGAGAPTIIEVLMAWPGLTFHAGCAYDLEKHVTIPNILKVFNPNLFGCSDTTGTSMGIFDTDFNVARSGAKADELPFQARSLVSTLNAHPKVNVTEDWKFLGIFIGTNDVCQLCVDQRTPDYFVSKIAEALEILRSNLPRTIVSILSIPQLDVIRESVQKPGCRMAQSILNIACPCLPNNRASQEKIDNFTSDYFNLQMNLQNSGRFDADDFTVVVQPFITEVHELPKNLSFFAPDCFHYSKLGHSLMSTFLWQNLLQPVNFKTAPESLDNPAKLSCPDEKCPFIRTVKNSIDCLQFLAPAMEIRRFGI